MRTAERFLKTRFSWVRKPLVHPTLPGGIIRLTVYASTQYTQGVQEGLAQALGLPVEKVRCVTEYMGGGFGSKFSAGGSRNLAGWSLNYLPNGGINHTIPFLKNSHPK